KAQMSPSQS
ncbi:hypothetical protein R3I94_011872, partial [Phoxinus phoxinus]